MLHKTDWSSIKQIKTDNSLTMYYVQDGTIYTVIEGDRSQIYWTILRESTDISNFETTYKTGATSVLSLDDAISKIFLSQDGASEIVDAIGNIGLSVALARFRPKFYLNKTKQDMTSSYKTLADIDFDGKLDSIAINFAGSANTVKVTVDGSVVLEALLSDLDSAAIYNVGSGHQERNIIKAVASGKSLEIMWQVPVDITSNLTVEAKDVLGGPTKVFDGIAIAYREKVV